MKPVGDGKDIAVVWNGEAFVPERHMLVYCDATFETGRRYHVRPASEPTSITKFEQMFHASVVQAYGNLDAYNRRNFLSVDHFRYFMLIRAGYCDLEEYVFADDAHARAFEKRERERRKTTGTYRMIIRTEDMVQVFTSWSMAHSKNAKLSPIHNREAFQEAAKKVLDMLAGDLNVNVLELIEASLNNG